MHGTVVERILGTRDAEKSGTLLEGRGSEARHLHKLCSRCERSVGTTVFHNILCESRTESADVGEEMLTGGVEIYTYRVDATLHCEVERLLQLRLVNIVLVLSHSDALRVNLHEFGKRIHQSPAYAHSSSHSNILVGKFLAGGL